MSNKALKETKLWFDLVRTIVYIVVTVVAIFFVAGGSQATAKSNADNHMANEDIHMPMSTRMEKFVPRSEMEVWMQKLEIQMKSIALAVGAEIPE